MARFDPRKFHKVPRFVQDRNELGDLDMSELIACWLLRLMLTLHQQSGGSRKIFGQPDLFPLVGIPALDDKARSRHSDAALQELLTDRLDELELLGNGQPLTLSKNIRLLGRRMGLSSAEREVLFFACVLIAQGKFFDFLDSLNLYCNADQAGQLVATMLNLPLSATRAALAPDGVLRRSGLIAMGPGIQQLSSKVRFEELFADILMSKHRNADALLNCFFREAARPSLNASHFPHVSQHIDLLAPLLGNASIGKEDGINILIHGEPGAGKTEFARLLAEMAGIALYEVRCTDMEGQSIKGSERFAAYQLCQNILSNSRRTAILFDEVEDVFPSGGSPIFLSLSGNQREARQHGKAWVNRILETNSVPAIWISNEIDGIDPAYLRRFSVIFEFPKPARSVRSAITAEHLQGLPISTGYIDRLANNEALTPGQISIAARAIRIREPDNERDAERMLEAVLNGSLRAIHGDSLKRKRPPALPYRLDALNTIPEPQELVAGLRQHNQASLCFYGPPGTGKTALGRHLAEALDKPLLVKRASDLLDKWVGASEKNIAAMFYEAEQEGAILLLDEADSFLSDRREARQHWEITQTNELLTRMEEFEGIFICTTNLLDQLDPAALRRFDFKVRFDYCNTEQGHELFADLLASFGLTEVGFDLLARLNRMRNLTPGDFAVTARQWRTRVDLPTSTHLLKALEEESALKGGRASGIGFHHA